MYEKNFKGNGVVRQLRFHQGKRNMSDSRAMLEPLTDAVDCSFKNILTNIDVRTTDGEIFKAKYLRKSTHFPYIVPELVDAQNKCLLITNLTYGSLNRLYNKVIGN